MRLFKHLIWRTGSGMKSPDRSAGLIVWTKAAPVVFNDLNIRVS